MVKVKTLVAHRNDFSEQQEKEPGAEYEAPDRLAELLIAEGLVERVAAHEKGKRG